MNDREATFVIEQAAPRADVSLAALLGESRAFAQKLFAAGLVLRDGAALKARDALIPGQTLIVTVPAPQPTNVTPEDIPLVILYQDADLAVLNKPAGLVVHPAAGHATGTLVHGLLFHLNDLSGVGGELRPGIVHRLDKDTSGLMVVAKNDVAHRALTAQLADHSCRRTYLALARGHFSVDEGTIDAPVGRHPTHRQRMAVVPTGRLAITHYRVLQALRGASLVQLDLQTGRTHQIRVHLQHIGHPVLDDPLYGGGSAPGSALASARQMLHAARLRFAHPATGQPMDFSAPPPEDFLRRLRGLGGTLAECNA